MKKAFIIASLFFYSALIAEAQNCELQIEILQDKYMFGQVSKMNNVATVKKMEVNFDEDFMQVVLTIEVQKYLIKVINQNCQAYCTK
jgi:hypothetical protein